MSKITRNTLTAINWILKNCEMNSEVSNKIKKKFGLAIVEEQPNIIFKTKPLTPEREEEVKKIISNFNGCISETICYDSPLEDDGRRKDESEQELITILNKEKIGVFYSCRTHGSTDNFFMSSYEHEITNIKRKYLISFWTQDC